MKGPRNRWREAISAAVQSRTTGVEYRDSDKLEVRDCAVYMDDWSVGFHDVNNRAKDVLDALQGRAGGPKSKRRLPVVIPDDHQIYRLIVGKKAPPRQSHKLGHVTIRRLGRIKIVHLKGDL